ncbi:MAG: hypothetical protein JWM93_3427 [Frankiales bacterium]|nr:hypothetical protein [Frankiales bacterium]
MSLRRPHHEPIDLDSYEVAYAELHTIRDAHRSCTESALDCRAGILWATNTAFMHLEDDLNAGTRRALLLDHAAQVNEMLAQRSNGRVGALLVFGTRLQAATATRSY